VKADDRHGHPAGLQLVASVEQRLRDVGGALTEEQLAT
jgi:hypothetical protein